MDAEIAFNLSFVKMFLLGDYSYVLDILHPTTIELPNVKRS